ncbi:MAG: 1-(5-phosphoribosyl)-5-[(5-phosphoribosylamino)methylideneamino]imidazole-4-carboxamide isomerase [Bacteroidia bacterium]|nr:1-(5-phosphoribosyl)-5-[(5-phosphoribosylamino)methylideneamino]imidazole-4-carboxamide isomerase [Bacteroidia bacterium]
MEIIPAIDIIDGKCIRLTQGDYSQKTIYNESPLEVALQFESIGIKRLHLVDLDGARQGKLVNIDILEKISSKTNLKIDYSGGISTDEAIEQVFSCGADIASIGSIAVKNKELFSSWLQKYGAAKILLGADVKHEKIAINGWLQTTDILLFDFIRDNIDKGVTSIFCTDVSKDGLMEGPSIELYKKIKNKFPELNLIGSGGVSNREDVLLLKEIGCSGIIIGKAIYEGSITLNELKKLL